MAHRVDPRDDPPSLDRVPALLRDGVDLFHARRWWHAHESWEEAWHALRAHARPRAASFLQGLILCSAALENLRRGKPDGFRRQMAQGLHQMRADRAAAAELGVRESVVDAMTDLYFDLARRTRLTGEADLPDSIPTIEFTSNP